LQSNKQKLEKQYGSKSNQTVGIKPFNVRHVQANILPFMDCICPMKTGRCLSQLNPIGGETKTNQDN
jgi:hypothetical protein